MDKRIEQIIQKWYIEEPALFQIYGTHNLEANERMACVMRCGKGKIEYNPRLIKKVDDRCLELYLKAEIIRILLKHPYDRQPDGCRKEVLGLGSNLVIGDNYSEFAKIQIPTPDQYNLDSHESFEWYSYRLEKRVPVTPDIHNPGNRIPVDTEGDDQLNGLVPSNDMTNRKEANDDPIGEEGESREKANSKEESQPLKVLIDIIKMPDGSEFPIYMDIQSNETGDDANVNADGNSTSSGNSKAQPSVTPSFPLPIYQGTAVEPISPEASYDLSSLWEEDYTKICEIDYQIEVINNSQSWGSISGDLINQILANTKARIDYRKVLSGFRASILSSKRNLTRMRPNRRTGFNNMGSIRRFNTNILIAVDVSGSVNDESLQHFFSIINRMFKYGIEQLDIMQFDTQIKSVSSIKKKELKFDIKGRGGTDFQIVFDYALEHPEYDGIIIFTDGYANRPTISKKMKSRIAWVCNEKKGYEANKNWMQSIGRCCLMEV